LDSARLSCARTYARSGISRYRAAKAIIKTRLITEHYPAAEGNDRCALACNTNGLNYVRNAPFSRVSGDCGYARLAVSFRPRGFRIRVRVHTWKPRARDLFREVHLTAIAYAIAIGVIIAHSAIPLRAIARSIYASGVSALSPALAPGSQMRNCFRESIMRCSTLRNHRRAALPSMIQFERPNGFGGRKLFIHLTLLLPNEIPTAPFPRNRAGRELIPRPGLLPGCCTLLLFPSRRYPPS